MPIPDNEFAGLRIRVERLLRGERRPEDLTALFLALRDFSGGRECIVEVGNFIAHRGERRIGITTREARDFFRIIRFYTAYTYQGRQLDLLDLPKDISELLAGSFRRTPNDMIRQHLAINRQTAEKNLNDLRSRLHQDSSGRISLAWPTNLDYVLLGCVLGHITAQPAFTDQQLIEQLSACLFSHGLLRGRERQTFRLLKEFVGIFAVASMHLCVIDLGDGFTAELGAGATKSQGAIGVAASSELSGLNPAGAIRIAATFFQTSISVFDCCDQELHPESDQTPVWPFHIELANTGKLTRLL
jgi:hypothetical protein